MPASLNLALLVGLLVVALVSWAVPRQLYVLTPQRWRRRLYGPGASWWPALALAAAPLPLAFPLGFVMDDPSLSPVQMGLTFGGALGGLTGAGLLFSWRRARREQAYAWAKTGPPLPGEADGIPPWLLDVPTAPTRPAVVQREEHRLARGARRVRRLLLASAPVLSAVAVMAQRSAGPYGPFPWPLFLAATAVLLLGLSIDPWLRWQTRHLAKAPARVLSGAVTLHDDDRVAKRFPHAPLLRATNRFDRLLHPVVVDGLTAGRHWWVVVQHAALHGDRRSLHRTTCLVWLPGVDLPLVLVRGRDNAEVGEWFSAGVVLESWDFHQRLLVLAAPEHQRQATDVLHPRMMEHLLAHLPDGASLAVRRDLLSLGFDRPLHLSEVEGVMSFLLGCADLLPTYLLKDHALAGR